MLKSLKVMVLPKKRPAKNNYSASCLPKCKIFNIPKAQTLHLPVRQLEGEHCTRTQHKRPEWKSEPDKEVRSTYRLNDRPGNGGPQ